MDEKAWGDGQRCGSAAPHGSGKMALRLGRQQAPCAPDLHQDHVGPKELKLCAVLRVQQRQPSVPGRIAAHELRQPRVGRLPLQ